MIKDKAYQSNIISDEIFAAIKRVASQAKITFVELSILGGLNPKTDFRHANLSGCDFSYCDISDFDFTGADLSGSTGILVNGTTLANFEDADLSGSIFASKVRLHRFFTRDSDATSILNRVSKEDWGSQIIWAGQNLLPGGKHQSIAMETTEALFYSSKQPILQSEFMKYLLPRFEDMEKRKELLLAAISQEPEANVVVKTSLRYVLKFGLADDSAIRQLVLKLIEANLASVRIECVRFILQNRPKRHEIEIIRSIAFERGSELGSIYVAEIAKMLGQEFDLVTRSPSENETFGPHFLVSKDILTLIARRWARVDANAAQKHLPLINRAQSLVPVSPSETTYRQNKILKMWEELKSYGINISVEP